MAKVAQLVFALLAFCGCGYYVVCIVSARSFRRRCDKARAKDETIFTPPVSILKPLRGTDPHMYECFHSHCLQNYPDYELIFGVSDADDSAVRLVRQLQADFPERRIVLVVCEQKLGTNIKVSNLAQMLPHAQHDHLVVNDSDILVDREYLRNIMAPMNQADVGMVTTLYRGASNRSLGSKLESLGIETDFAAGVLTAQLLEGGVRFGLGSTLAFKREALDAIGGFAPLLDFLADDYELGKRMAEQGYKVVLSDEMVDTFLPDYRFAEYWQHQLRWMRGIRAARGGGYAGLVFTYGIPFAIATAIAARGALWSLALVAATVGLRLVEASQVASRVLKDRHIRYEFWLIPLRDILALALWAAAYGSSTVVWRGDEFTLKDGKLQRSA